MHASDTRFRSLADLLRTDPVEPPAAPVESVPAPPIPPAGPAAQAPEAPADGARPIASAVLSEAATAVSALPAIATEAQSESAGGEDVAALRDARLFRAALADAADMLCAKLADALARAVLARELASAPVDIAALAQRLCAEFAADEPLRLRVAPPDAALVCGLPVSADPELAPGDAILECRSGTIDARLRVRLAQVVAEVAR